MLSHRVVERTEWVSLGKMLRTGPFQANSTKVLTVMIIQMRVRATIPIEGLNIAVWGQGQVPNLHKTPNPHNDTSRQILCTFYR